MQRCVGSDSFQGGQLYFYGHNLDKKQGKQSPNNQPKINKKPTNHQQIVFEQSFTVN